MRTSNAIHRPSTWRSTLLLVRPCVPCWQLLRPLLTSRSGPTIAFQACGEISPGTNALLDCTAAAFTPLLLDHENFVVCCPLFLRGSAFYPILVNRLFQFRSVPCRMRHILTVSYPHADALHFVRSCELTAGLAPATVRPCWRIINAVQT